METKPVNISCVSGTKIYKGSYLEEVPVLVMMLVESAYALVV